MKPETKKILFHKMHGLGNDFILIDHRFSTHSFPFFSTTQIQRLCHRHFGIGADGILFLSSSTKADVKLDIWNQDGSLAEMCGNGLRCAAHYLWEKQGELQKDTLIPSGEEKSNFSDKETLLFETRAGILSCTRGMDSESNNYIETAMGAPKFARKYIPMTGPGQEEAQNVLLSLDQQTFSLSAVSMGNPHIVIFLNNSQDLFQMAKQYGPLLENHSLFPQKTNVNFVKQNSPLDFELVVWERGCGITNACGTGASATLVIACKLGFCPIDTWASIHLPGGSLRGKVLPHFQNVLLRGLAKHVFHGFLSETFLSDFTNLSLIL